MDDLIAEITTQNGLGRPTVEKALGIIISFLEREGPTGKVTPMIDELPGARALAAANGSKGGGLFAVFGELSAAGLGLGEIQAIARAFVAYAKARLGESEVDTVIRAMPGAGQFI
jgi:hypothetical protein